MATGTIRKIGWDYQNLTGIDWIGGGTWTAPSDGMITAVIGASAAGAVLRFRNVTASDTVLTCQTIAIGNNNSFAGSFPVRAGNTYSVINASSTITGINARYYKLT